MWKMVCLWHTWESSDIGKIRLMVSDWANGDYG